RRRAGEQHSLLRGGRTLGGVRRPRRSQRRVPRARSKGGAMRLVVCVIVLACPVLSWADEARTAVEGRQGDRPYPFRAGDATEGEGLPLALLGGCGAAAHRGGAWKERWEPIPQPDDSLRVAFPRPRPVATGAGEKSFVAPEILMHISMGKNGARPP